MSAYPRRTIALGPPYDDGTVPGEPDTGPPPTRVQFGDDGIRLVPVVDPLTVDQLAAMLHEATAGCYPEGRCQDFHRIDAGALLPLLAVYLHEHPVTTPTPPGRREP